MIGGRFQILSLDGGGLRGMFSAAVLARLEDDLQLRITDHFDLIAGTSTGGIIAIGLGLGLTPREIVEFYAEHGPRIFRDAPGPADSADSFEPSTRPSRCATGSPRSSASAGSGRAPSVS